MAMYVGEALAGEGNEIAHIDLLIGDKDGPVGFAFANALARQSAGHTNLLAVLTPNLAVKPATVMITKVTIQGMKQAVQMFGPAQSAVAKAVADCVADGRHPQGSGRRPGHRLRRVHSSSGRRRQEDLPVQLRGHEDGHPQRDGGQADGRRNARRQRSGRPPVPRILEPKSAPPAIRSATSTLDPASNMTTRPKILIQLDGDSQASIFDAVVAIDAGVDQLLRHHGVRPEQVRSLVYGAMFTRGVDQLHRTAVFVGGSDVTAGEALFAEVCRTFFGPMRVSVMFDSNGANTTAAAAVLAAESHVAASRLDGAGAGRDRGRWAAAWCTCWPAKGPKSASASRTSTGLGRRARAARARIPGRQVSSWLATARRNRGGRSRDAAS